MTARSLLWPRRSSTIRRGGSPKKMQMNKPQAWVARNARNTPSQPRDRGSPRFAATLSASYTPAARPRDAIAAHDARNATIAASGDSGVHLVTRPRLNCRGVGDFGTLDFRSPRNLGADGTRAMSMTCRAAQQRPELQPHKPRPLGATPRPSVKRKGVALRLIVKNLAGTNYLTGTDYLLEMWTSDTVLHVKEMIEDVDGIPASQQRLIQNDDELLDDGNTLGRVEQYFPSIPWTLVPSLICPPP